VEFKLSFSSLFFFAFPLLPSALKHLLSSRLSRFTLPPDEFLLRFLLPVPFTQPFAPDEFFLTARALHRQIYFFLRNIQRFIAVRATNWNVHYTSLQLPYFSAIVKDSSRRARRNQKIGEATSATN
jgi:hypothetical protein